MVTKKASEKNRVVITGLAPICSLGIGKEEVWKSLLESKLNLVKETYTLGNKRWGEFYLHKMLDFNIKKFDLPKANFKFIEELRTVKQEDIDLYYFLAVIKLAIEDSELQYDKEKNDIGLILTHENPGVETFFEELVDSVYEIFKKNKDKQISKLHLAQEIFDKGCEERGYNLQTFSYLFAAAKLFDLHGFSLFINNACASGIFAIDVAARQIKAGISPAVIVAAVDNPTKIYKYLWFKKQNLYADDGITRPFSNDPSGIVFGDGGAALVLEDLQHAKARGARIYGEYLGGGFSLEGWKITVPNICDDFYTRSFRKALDISGIRPDDIDMVNPHGVGTKIADTYEAKTINNIFKKYQPFISAFKPLIGHNLGGSALLETAISLISLQKNIIPASLNCENPNIKLNLKMVKKNRKQKMNIIAKMSFGFAGFNGVAIFRK